MYRNNNRESIPDKIDLFRDFYDADESIDKTAFYKLAVV
jgi:hypothetical protein